MCQRTTLAAFFLLMTLCSFGRPAYSGEVGLLTGAGLELKDTIDVFEISPYIGSGSPGSNQRGAEFLLRITFGIGIDTPANTDFLSISLEPTAEYNLLVFADNFLVTPGFGFGLIYANTKIAGTTFHTFGVGLIPSLTIKYRMTDNLILRATPIALELSPWRYTDGNVGSSHQFQMAYRLAFGVGWLF